MELKCRPIMSMLLAGPSHFSRFMWELVTVPISIKFLNNIHALLKSLEIDSERMGPPKKSSIYTVREIGIE